MKKSKPKLNLSAKKKYILIFFVVFIIIPLILFFLIPRIVSKSGGGTLEAHKNCTCIGIPYNDIRYGGSRFYCIGIVTDCHCYVGTYYNLKVHNITEVDCNCPEGKYYKDFPAGRTDYCNLFRTW